MPETRTANKSDKSYKARRRKREAIPKKRKPKQWETIAALANGGEPPKRITTITGIDGDVVRATLAKLRREGVVGMWFKEQPSTKAGKQLTYTVAAKVPADVRDAIKKAATKRRTRPTTLITRLLVILARDSMFDAILDDQE